MMDPQRYFDLDTIFRESTDKSREVFCYNDYEILCSSIQILYCMHKSDADNSIRSSILTYAERRLMDVYDIPNNHIVKEKSICLYNRCKEALIWECSKDCKTLLLKIQILNDCCQHTECPTYLFTKCILEGIRLYSIFEIQAE